MSRIVSMTAAGIAVIGLALLGGAAQAQDKKAGKCVLAGGEATMITGDLARFMANAALNNSIKGMNATASGAVKMDCKDAFASVYCKATQRACK